MRTLFLIITLLFTAQAKLPADPDKSKSETTECAISQTIKNKLLSIIQTDLGKWKTYPKPTLPSCDVFKGVSREIKNPKGRVLFETFSKSQDERLDAITKTSSDDLHILLAMSVHGNPSVRVAATKRIKILLCLKLLINTSTQGQKKFEKNEKIVAKFFQHILDTTPHSIEGSENATIHGIYLSEIKKTLHFIKTGKL